MARGRLKRDIQTRQQLFDFLQAQMQTAYRSLHKSQRLEFESTLIKSYIFEVDVPNELFACPQSHKVWVDFIQKLFHPSGYEGLSLQVQAKEEEGFFELDLHYRNKRAILYLDSLTDKRFWLGFSISDSRVLDWWFEAMIKTRSEIDFVWLWPSFLERVQDRGDPRGFGLDYDYRKFESESHERTTYFKMQLWGGRETADLYRWLKKHPVFGDKAVLAKVRLKEWGEDPSRELFALQDVKYTGKITTRGTDFTTHASTLNFVRSEYGKRIQSLEERYSLRWEEVKQGGVVLEGFPIHFIPQGFHLPVLEFCKHVLDGTAPFRLIGLVSYARDTQAVVEVVDLHTGGELSFEIYPDILTIYLPERTCGNTIARLYTNLQHYFNTRFEVEADDGKRLF
ncbi:hypothetical protein DRN74_05205 [Candidatus Micrarchaeota archaeon]|nr:MAG: hypothetical protein DRN74_05205 [Candidatus Micrarchaeota archaeon]